MDVVMRSGSEPNHCSADGTWAVITGYCRELPLDGFLSLVFRGQVGFELTFQSPNSRTLALANNRSSSASRFEFSTSGFRSSSSGLPVFE